MNEQYDEDENGSIEFPEFAAMLADKRCATKLEQGYAAKFKKYDRDSSGFISEKELIKGLKKMNDLEINKEEIQGIIKMVNTNKSGGLNYFDFIKVLRYKGLVE